MFDATYVINLDRSTDRWTSVSRVIASAGFRNVIRFPAVDGALLGELGIAELQQRSVLASDLSGFDQQALLGEVGCALSHAQVLDDIIAKGFKSALILEDDIELAGDAKTWPARLQAAFADLPSSWEMWFLYRCFDVAHRAKRRSPRTVVPYSPQGCAAFAVSAAGARKLRAATQPVANACDRAYMPLVRARSIKAFAASPLLIDPGTHRTEIVRGSPGKWIVDGVNRPPEYWSPSDLEFIGDPVPIPLAQRITRFAAQIRRDWNDGRIKWYAVPFKVVRRSFRIARRVVFR